MRAIMFLIGLIVGAVIAAAIFWRVAGISLNLFLPG